MIVGNQAERQNFVSRSFLLTCDQIKQLSPKTTIDELAKMCADHPNDEDQLVYREAMLRSAKRPTVLYYWFNDRESLRSVVAKTGLPPDGVQEILWDEVQRISAAVPIFKGLTVVFHTTSRWDTYKDLTGLAFDNSERYLSLMGQFLSDDLKIMVRTEPYKCDKLREFCTYSPRVNATSLIVMEPSKWYRSDYGQALPRAVEEIFEISFKPFGPK